MIPEAEPGKIAVKYSCGTCSTETFTVIVPERSRAVDVGLWINVVIGHVANDHARRSPFCRASKLEKLMIPVEDHDTGKSAEFVGQNPK